METLLGVFIGGFISLVGVILTLRWNQKLHEENLREERRKTKEEREFSAKKDSLMSACEALARLIDYYFLIPDKNLPKDGNMPKEFTDLNVAFNRLHFYCSMETIEKTSRLSNVLGKAFIEALTARLKSGFIEIDIETIEQEISYLEKWNTSIRDEINALFQSEPENPLHVYNRELLAKNLRKMGDLSGKKCELIELKFVETEKCRDVVFSHIKTIYKSMSKVLMLARKELSFPIDEKKYRDLIVESIEETEKVLKEFFTSIRNQFADKMEEDEDQQEKELFDS